MVNTFYIYFIYICFIFVFHKNYRNELIIFNIFFSTYSIQILKSYFSKFYKKRKNKKEEK